MEIGQLENESNISKYFFMSLKISAFQEDGEPCGVGTGFLLSHNENFFFVTNYHVVTAKDLQGRGIFGRQMYPFELRVSLPAAEGKSGMTRRRIEFTLPLLSGEKPNVRRTWSSMFLGESGLFSILDDGVSTNLETIPEADIAVFRLDRRFIEEFALEKFTYELEIEPFKTLRVTDRVYVIGYPASLDAFVPNLPIWTSGTVASEPNDGIGMRFFIDSRTRPGQSGSPVVAYRRRDYVSASDGPATYLPEVAVLLGIYSGRTDSDSDIGSVWKTGIIKHAVEESLEYSRRCQPPLYPN